MGRVDMIQEVRKTDDCPVNDHEACRLVHDGFDFMECSTEEAAGFPDYCPLLSGEVIIRKVE